MKISSLIIKVVAVLLMMGISFGVGYAATIDAKSGSYPDVSYAVSLATYGDTIVVPQGTRNWDKELVITKFLTLQGAGIGKTVITNSGINDTLKALIRYSPDSTSRSVDGLFRVTGLTLKNTGGNASNSSSKGICLDGNNQTTTHLYNIRIDHNSFYDFIFYDDGIVGNQPKYYGNAIHFRDGMWFGLIDSNEFYGLTYADTRAIYIDGMNTNSWVDHSVGLGSAGALYVEDNYFDTFRRAIISGHGCRWVFRFNELIKPQDSWTCFDAHGNWNSASTLPLFPNDASKPGSRGVVSQEVYKNRLTAYPGRSSTFWGSRGGTSVTWGNEFISSSYAVTPVRLAEEDSPYYKKWVPSVVRHYNVYYECKVDHTASSASEPGVGSQWQTYWKTNPYQKSNYSNWQVGALYLYDHGYDPVKDTYIWENKYNGNLKGGSVYSPDNAYLETTHFIRADRDYWNQTTDFNGASGMGVGTKAQMLAIRPAALGVGFWVMEEGTWNQSGGNNVLSYSGQGVLYRAAPKQGGGFEWRKYYEPYTYPHPLRGGLQHKAGAISNAVKPPSGVGVVVVR